YDPITEDFPVSIFQLHRDLTVIIDEDAATLIKNNI
ncbi:MAG: glucosamine-6-phosphate isomerase, partial [Bacilli bacterium]